MRILGTRTESETIDAALDLVTFGPDPVEGIKGMRGAGLIDVFADNHLMPQGR
jgi:hypothetical protein